MSESEALVPIHPQGEREQPWENEAEATVETFGGKVSLRWGEEAAVTAFGKLPYFVEFLKTSGLFEDWVQDCPQAGLLQPECAR